jgi:hypothetical protein
MLKIKTFDEILKDRLKIKEDLSFFYSDYELHSVKINIEIMLQYHLDGKIAEEWEKIERISGSIESAFSQTS